MTTAATKPLSAHERRRLVQRLADTIDRDGDLYAAAPGLAEAILWVVTDETGVEL